MSAYSVHLGLLLLTSFVLVRAESNRIVKLRKFKKVHEDENSFQSSVELGEPDDEGHIKLSGEIATQVTLDNDWKVNITLYRKASEDDKYGTFMDLPVIGSCDLMSTYYKDFFYEKLKDYSNAPHPDDCPLAPQKFHLKDYPINSSQLGKFLQAGDYRVVGQLVKDEELKLEYLAEFQVE
ncbi:uncharacterized protein CheA87a [Drosophila montana]|uniref:uncharacterized protein CheA87a n=1 Tax=Drosophila montana TaxID=40370 RepID=UPI00313ABDF7